VNLVIDRGNTQIKVGIFDQGKLMHFDSALFLDKRKIMELVQEYNIRQAILSSVVKEQNDSLLKILHECIPSVMELTHESKLPFSWTYQSKSTMGKDRLAAVAGGMAIYPQTNLLVIDAGTAITYEVVTANQNYLGGNISPGLQMRFKALHHFTSKLPLLTPEEDTPMVGNDTDGAIRAGIQYGMLHEIEGLIQHLSDTYPSLKTVITGGDAEFFARKLKNPIFVHPNLVLIGLNRILENNA